MALSIPPRKAQRKSSPPAGAPPSSLPVPKEVEVAIRQRVAKEQLAFETGLRLCGPEVSEEDLRLAAPFLHATHYDDVLEERTNDLFCAYPCCSARLVPFQPRQRVTVSRADRRIYRTDTLRRFCSNECSARSAAYARSLSREPVSQRDTVDAQLRPRDPAALAASEASDRLRRHPVGSVVERSPSSAVAEDGAGAGGRSGAAAALGSGTDAAQLAALARAVDGHVPRSSANSAGPQGCEPAPPGRAMHGRARDRVDGGHGDGSTDEGHGRSEGALHPSAGASALPADGLDLATPIQPAPALGRVDLSPFALTWTYLSAAATQDTSLWLQGQAGAGEVAIRAAAAGSPSGGPGAATARGGAGGGSPSGDGLGWSGVTAGTSTCEEELEAMLEHALQLKAELSAAEPPPLASRGRPARVAGEPVVREESETEETEASEMEVSVPQVHSMRGGAGAPVPQGGGGARTRTATIREKGAKDEVAGDEWERAGGAARMSEEEEEEDAPPHSGNRGRANSGRGGTAAAGGRGLRALASTTGQGHGELLARARALVNNAGGDAPRAVLALRPLLGTLRADGGGPALSAALLDVCTALLLDRAGEPLPQAYVEDVLRRARLDVHHFSALSNALSAGSS